MARALKIPRHGKTPIGAYYSPGIFNDGGGIIIIPGKDGKLHIRHVPPREPVLSQLGLVATLMAHGETLRDKEIKRQALSLAESVASGVLGAPAVIE